MKSVMIVVFFCFAVLSFSCQKKTETATIVDQSTYPSWVKSWYKLQPWEEKNGRGFDFNAQLRRYGGDIQGIIDKLDYLEDLGINAIYLNPVFESPSLHKYDATYYHHIDDNFGPDPQKDREIIVTENFDDPATWKWTTADKLFLEFLKHAHDRNIKVIIDGVFNHVGMTFWAFKDVHENGEKSPYKDWFVIKQYDDTGRFYRYRQRAKRTYLCRGQTLDGSER
jgi:glycosidase